MTRTELINKANDIYWNDFDHKEQRLSSCSALYKDFDSYVILRSYNTIVAIYYKSSGTLYVFDYWSATTTQHCWKFARLMNAMRMTCLYKRSDNKIEIALDRYANTVTFGKLMFEKIKELDFTSVISNKIFE